MGQQKLKHLVSSVLGGGWCFVDNPSRLMGPVTELARCVGIVSPLLSLPSVSLDGRRHEISMFEAAVFLVHRQKLLPTADSGSAPDTSSIITTAKFSQDPRLGCLGLSCHLQEGEEGAEAHGPRLLLESTLNPARAEPFSPCGQWLPAAFWSHSLLPPLRVVWAGLRGGGGAGLLKAHAVQEPCPK